MLLYIYNKTEKHFLQVQVALTMMELNDLQ